MHQQRCDGHHAVTEGAGSFQRGPGSFQGRGLPAAAVPSSRAKAFHRGYSLWLLVTAFS